MQATQATMDLGRKFLSSLGIGGSPASAVPGGRVSGPQAIEYVIARGASQRGVPLLPGAAAPSTGPAPVSSRTPARSATTARVHPLCLRRVGVLLPKYSGDQYNAGRHIPPSQAKRAT